MTGYYDIVLGLIPLSLFGVSGVLTVAGLEMNHAIFVAGTIAIGCMGHALFVRTPTGTVRTETDSSQSPPPSSRVETNPVNSE